MARELHDHYFKEAKREGYRSRAAYKLLEINERRKVLARGDVVLDCGAAPGSWLQVASAAVGPRGRVLGVDLSPIEALPELANVVTVTADLRELAPDALRAAVELADDATFDVLLSDMAPQTTGDRTIDHHGSMRLAHLVLDLARTLLKRNGNVVIKVLEGEAYPALLERTRACFDAAKGFKPKASRTMSTELFVVAKGYRVERPPSEAEVPVRKPKPKGWG